MPRIVEDIVGLPSRLARYSVALDKAMSWIVALAGFALAIWTTARGDEVSEPWILFIIAVDSVLLVLLGIFSAVLFARQRVTMEREIAKVRAQAEAADSVRLSSEDRDKREIARRDEKIRLSRELHEDLLQQQSTLTRSTIESINHISEAANMHYERMERLSSIIDSDEIKGEVDNDKIPASVYRYCIDDGVKSLESFRSELFHEHNLYLKEVLDVGCRMIRSYLHLKGRDLKVAMAVKLFLEPDMEDELLAKSPARIIFTAFRDTKTFEQERRRENPPQRFSVKGNTDFEHCLATGSAYVFNNATKGGAFRNESSYFGTLYNSGVTVEIVSRVRGSREPGVVYGFLACDVNNTNVNDMPMDESVVAILIAMRNLIALFYDQVSSIWEYIFDFDSPEEDNMDVGKHRSFFEAYYDYLDTNRQLD